jgi:VWFA-related protein
MRLVLLIATGLLGLTLVPSPARAADDVEYTVEIVKEKGKPVVFSRIVGDERHVTVDFQIKRIRDREIITSVPKDEIVVKEEGKTVAIIDLKQPKAQALTVVLAMDISGSMARNGKIDAAKKAALAFLDKLDERANVGLILFDHEIKVAKPPVQKEEEQRGHRTRLREIIQATSPQGGTAYHDATIEAVKMLRGIQGRRAVVLMTDGADTNSKNSLDDAIKSAITTEVPVYTLGIGDPGKNDPVTTVLVLDCSGSMGQKADDGDKGSKMLALQRAAKRFVALMRPSAQTTLLPFSDKREDGSTGIDPAKPFTRDAKVLNGRIDKLRPLGGTLLYDASYAGLETLEASGVKGKRAVVVMTDGKDESPGSRISDDGVIERARELKIPLYMLGLGRKAEIDEKVMRKMAKETGGDFYHAGTEKKLLEVFENLSIELHDDGIDEESLGKLAKETGGRYTHVSKIDELQLIYEKLADELQNTYKVTFKSNYPAQDGTARAIDVVIVRQGKQISTAGKVDDVARGVVVPQMSYVIYLVFLAALGALLAFPGLMRRLVKGGTG